MLRSLAVPLALLLQTTNAPAEQRQALDRPGDVYVIRLEAVSVTSGDGSSGSSRSVTILEERVIALRDDSVELEFDLPEQASQTDRDRTWQFPVRVLKSPKVPLQLLNASELQTRVQSWLERGGFTETSCGHWIFTWTAIKIECDPHSVLQALEPFDLRVSDLRGGALYAETGARGPAPLQEKSRSPDGAVFVAEMEIDPEAVRRERAQTDVVVAEIMRQEPVALEAALQAWAAKQIVGTITTTLETDTVGRVTRRTQVTDVAITDVDGSQERVSSTVTVERRQVLHPEGQP